MDFFWKNRFDQLLCRFTHVYNVGVRVKEAFTKISLFMRYTK